jgi:hypothetical protein
VAAYRAYDRIMRVRYNDSVRQQTHQRIAERGPHGVAVHVRGAAQEAFQANHHRCQGLAYHRANRIPLCLKQETAFDEYNADAGFFVFSEFDAESALEDHRNNFATC